MHYIYLWFFRLSTVVHKYISNIIVSSNLKLSIINLVAVRAVQSMNIFRIKFPLRGVQERPNCDISTNTYSSWSIQIIFSLFSSACVTNASHFMSYFWETMRFFMLEFSLKETSKSRKVSTPKHFHTDSIEIVKVNFMIIVLLCSKALPTFNRSNAEIFHILLVILFLKHMHEARECRSKQLICSLFLSKENYFCLTGINY